MESASYTGNSNHSCQGSPQFDLESNFLSINSVENLWHSSVVGSNGDRFVRESDLFINDQFNSYDDSFAGFSTLSTFSYENDLSSSSGRSESDGDAESIGDFNRLESSDSNSVDRMKSCSRLNVPIAPATARGTADSKANSLALAAGATVIVAPAGHSFTLSQNGDQTTTINCTTGTNGSVRSVVFLPSTQTTLSLGQTAGTTNNQSDPTGGQQPQLSVVDENSLLDEMAKNKEALRVKLMLRRPIKQLVDQGIMPSLKVPPGFYEQKTRLERTKTGDLLKHKIQQRPDKQKLLAQHILLDEPSIQEKHQQHLKKCRISESLNEKLAFRPGSLELVPRNILNVEETLDQVVKDSSVGQFKLTSAGLPVKQSAHNNGLFSFSEGSLEGLNFDVDVSKLSSLGSSMPGLTLSNGGGSGFALSRSDSGESQSSNLSFLIQNSRDATPPALLSNNNLEEISFTSGGSRPNVVSSGKMALVKGQRHKKKLVKSFLPSTSPSVISVESPGSVGNGPKGRIIKFHEYKGPATKSCESILKSQPDCAEMSASSSGSSSICSNRSSTGDGSQNGFSPMLNGSEMSSQTGTNESSYDLMLQQQQVLLQWQLELQKKYPNANIQLMPAPASRNPDGTVTVSAASVITPKEVGDSGGSVTITTGMSDANFNSLYNSTVLGANGLESNYEQSEHNLISRSQSYSEGSMPQLSNGGWLNVPRVSPANLNTAQYGAGSFVESIADSSDCSDVSTPSPQTSHRASMSLSSPGTTAVCYQFSQSNISTSGVDHGANGFPTMSFVDPAPPTDNFESLNSGYPSLSVSPNDGETHPTQMCGENSEPGGIKSVVAGKSKKLGSAGQKKKTTEITGKPTEGCKQPKKLNGVVKSTLKAKKSDSSAMSDEAKLVINKLDDMKVSDLKAECKKRNLPVSGPKPNLLERLKPYEEGIMVGIRAKQQAEAMNSEELERESVESTGPFQPPQPAKLPPIQNVTSFLGLKGSTGGFPMDSCDVGSGRNLSAQFLPTFQGGDELGNDRNSMSDSNANGTNGYLQAQISSPTVSSTGPQSEYSAAGNLPGTIGFNTPRLSADFSILNFNSANVAEQPSMGFSGHSNGDTSGNLIVDNNYQLVETSDEARSAGFRQQCFTYTSQNSGGQFIVNTTTNAESSDSHHNSVTPPHLLPDTKLIVTESNRTYPSVPMEVDSTEGQQQNLPNGYDVAVAESRPDIDENELFQSKNSLTSSSASALFLHEEVLRQQQKRIEELQRELQKSQDQLRRQQQVIIAAKKAQSEKTAASGDGLSSEYDTILAQLDTKQLQKFHIQLFLQHKLQQQQLQQMTTQQELQNQQAKLKEEFSVHQAVQEVVHLLRREPRAAQTIVRLLKSHQTKGPKGLETEKPVTAEVENDTRSGSCAQTPNTTTSSSSSSASPVSCGPPVSVRSKSRQASGARSTDSKKSHTSSLSVPKGTSLPTSPAKTKVITPLDADHMEEIFKSVLSYAEKLTSASGNPSEDQSDPLQHRQQSSSECPDGLEEQSEFNYTPDDGVEMSDEHLMFASQDSRMFASRYDFAQSAPNYTGQVMDYYPNNHGVVNSVGNDSLTMYTKNEALDDLLEILRNNEADECSGQFLQSFPNTFAGEPNDVSNVTHSGWFGMNGSMPISASTQAVSCNDEIPPHCEQMEWLERMMQSPGSFNTSIVESQENPQFPEISSSGQSTITTTAEMFSNSAKSQSISVTAMRKSCNPLLAAEQVPLKQRKSDVTGAPAASITTNDLNSKSDPGKLGLDTFELFNFVDQNDAELELRLA